MTLSSIFTGVETKTLQCNPAIGLREDAPIGYKFLHTKYLKGPQNPAPIAGFYCILGVLKLHLYILEICVL